MDESFFFYLCLCVANTDNDGADSNNFVFFIPDTKLYVPVVTLSTEDKQKLSKLLSKWLERSVY